MIIASIDIGTNTVLLLLAKINTISQTLSPLLNEYRMPRLGKGLKKGGTIRKDRIEELFVILNDYKKIIDSHQADKVLITATNAFRIAANANEIVKNIKDQFDYNVNIISGEEESEYAFYGAVPQSANNQLCLVIDIGGGSTELITGKNDKIKYRKSFQIGSVSSTENFLKYAPPKIDELDKLDTELSKIFMDIKNNLVPDLIFAVAGTPTTIACMVKDLKEYDDKIVEGSHLSLSDLKQLSEELKLLTPNEVKKRFGKVMRGREDIILGGSLIMLKIMELLELQDLIVSARGIRYGAINKYLKDYGEVKS
jgi:exopolyphosphatase/guanosine-5'-triphosphate,3'-diphosphate pyrophosphatase